MKTRFTPRVVTTNHLLEGDPIYLRNDGSWTRDFTKAHIFSNHEQAESALANAQEQWGIHVGAYFADAELDADGIPRPKHFREKFRAFGPSIRYPGKRSEA